MAAERLGFSKSKANALIAGLVDQGLLAESGLQRLRAVAAQKIFNSTVRSVSSSASTSCHQPRRRGAQPGTRRAGPSRRGRRCEARPGVVLARVRALMRELLGQCGRSARDVIGIGIGVPGPVNFETGQLVNPPLMPAWDGFSIRDYLREDYAAPVFVDNDVNLMALGELWRLQRSLTNFLVIKVGTGIGCGIVCHGVVYRGAAGSAGDVGHICVDQEGPRCHCGNVGCVEVMAAGPAITRMAVEAAEAGESEVLAECLRTHGHIDAQHVGEAAVRATQRPTTSFSAPAA